ncbi:MAG: hypothetical protein JW944_05960 [Deltaproteobacteria bacterium]|nr:hypothetical protein [Deltaproteobacteria bacterium]
MFSDILRMLFARGLLPVKPIEAKIMMKNRIKTPGGFKAFRDLIKNIQDQGIALARKQGRVVDGKILIRHY